MVSGLFGHTTYSCTIYGYSQVNGPISDPLSVTTLQGGIHSYIVSITYGLYIDYIVQAL